MYRLKIYVVIEFVLVLYDARGRTEDECILCPKEHYGYCIRQVHPHEDQLDKHAILGCFQDTGSICVT